MIICEDKMCKNVTAYDGQIYFVNDNDQSTSKDTSVFIHAHSK